MKRRSEIRQYDRIIKEILVLFRNAVTEVKQDGKTTRAIGVALDTYLHTKSEDP